MRLTVETTQGKEWQVIKKPDRFHTWTKMLVWLVHSQRLNIRYIIIILVAIIPQCVRLKKNRARRRCCWSTTSRKYLSSNHCRSFSINRNSRNKKYLRKLRSIKPTCSISMTINYICTAFSPTPIQSLRCKSDAYPRASKDGFNPTRD